MSIGSALSDVKNTLYAMLVTYLALGTRDLVNGFPTVPVDATTSHRYITFEKDEDGNPQQVFVVNRAVADWFVTPGVNLYFGDPVALKKKDLPQRMFLPVFIHVMLPYTDEHRVGEAQAERLGDFVMNAFQGIGGQQQLYDFFVSPALAQAGRFVSWAREYRGQWRELGNPTKEAFTNRQWTFQVRYVR